MRHVGTERLLHSRHNGPRDDILLAGRQLIAADAARQEEIVGQRMVTALVKNTMLRRPDMIDTAVADMCLFALLPVTYTLYFASANLRTNLSQ